MPHACCVGVCGFARLGDTILALELSVSGAFVSVSLNVTLILTTVPDAAVAQKLATDALAARLCACVTQLGTVQSSYHWQGAVETAQEIQLLFKTSAARALELEQYIQAHHPYDTPEILSWQATASAAYGQWISAETQRPLHV